MAVKLFFLTFKMTYIQHLPNVIQHSLIVFKKRRCGVYIFIQTCSLGGKKKEGSAHAAPPSCTRPGHMPFPGLDILVSDITCDSQMSILDESLNGNSN